MAVPKKKKSKQRTAESRAGKKKVEIISLSACKNCGTPCIPHRVCNSCGHYGGRVYEALAKKAS